MSALKRLGAIPRARVILLAPALLLIALTAWAFASPVGASPDDDFHLGSIWCANSLNTSACLPGPTAGTKLVPEAVREAPLCYRFDPTVSAACQLQRFSFDPAPKYVSTRGSFANDYPPVYYLSMSTLVGPNIIVSVLAMRVLNIVLFLAMLTAVCILVPSRLRPPLLWSWLITSVPLGVFILSSNNPSAWALIGIGTTWASLMGFFETTGKRRWALGALFAVGVLMAAGARADSAIYVGLSIALVLLICFRRERAFFVRAILPLAMGLVALFFYVTSGQSAVATSGLGSLDDLGPERSIGAILSFNLLHLPDLLAGSFGTWQLGWLDTPMPPIVAFCALVVFVGIVFSAAADLTRRKAIAVGIIAVTVIALPLYVLYKGNNFVGEVLQPRYLLPLILLFGAFVLLPTGRRVLRLSWVQGGVVALALATANAVALDINIRRYVTGLDVGGVDLSAGAEWWWPAFGVSPMAVWVIGTLAFGAAVVITVWELIRRREEAVQSLPVAALD